MSSCVSLLFYIFFLYTGISYFSFISLITFSLPLSSFLLSPSPPPLPFCPFCVSVFLSVSSLSLWFCLCLLLFSCLSASLLPPYNVDGMIPLSWNYHYKFFLLPTGDINHKFSSPTPTPWEILWSLPKKTTIWMTNSN